MAAGKLKETLVITDFNQPIACILAAGFCFNDEHREGIATLRFRANSLQERL